jgi:hypothetical protein
VCAALIGATVPTMSLSAVACGAGASSRRHAPALEMSNTVQATLMPPPRSSAGQLARNRRPADGEPPAGRLRRLTFTGKEFDRLSLAILLQTYG